jgi:hypothetical protein
MEKKKLFSKLKLKNKIDKKTRLNNLNNNYNFKKIF